MNKYFSSFIFPVISRPAMKNYKWRERKSANTKYNFRSNILFPQFLISFQFVSLICMPIGTMRPDPVKINVEKEIEMSSLKTSWSGHTRIGTMNRQFKWVSIDSALFPIANGTNGRLPPVCLSLICVELQCSISSRLKLPN